jgi:hypothetical protein
MNESISFLGHLSTRIYALFNNNDQLLLRRSSSRHNLRPFLLNYCRTRAPDPLDFFIFSSDMLKESMIVGINLLGVQISVLTKLTEDRF